MLNSGIRIDVNTGIYAGDATGRYLGTVIYDMDDIGLSPH